VPYLLVYFASVLVDCIPIFAPPAWMLMMLIMVKFNLNPWIVAAVGTAGTTSGRLIFSGFIVPWIGKKTLGTKKQSDLDFLGKKLSNKGWQTVLFVFIYSVLPISTTPLFAAAGLAKLKRKFIVPPFFIGNLIGDGMLLISGKYVINNFDDISKDAFSAKSILFMTASLLVVFVFLFIDWHEAIVRSKFKLKFKFWE
jgi:membrane protein YqaA with SNARE-associated domain